MVVFRADTVMSRADTIIFPADMVVSRAETVGNPSNTGASGRHTVVVRADAIGNAGHGCVSSKYVAARSPDAGAQHRNDLQQRSWSTRVSMPSPGLTSYAVERHFAALHLGYLLAVILELGTPRAHFGWRDGFECSLKGVRREIVACANVGPN